MTLAALPLVVPSYVAALSLIAATGPSGVLVEIPTPYGFVGSWLVLSVFTAPLVHLTLIPGLRAIDPATEESATGLGASRWRVFATVTLPQLKPALVSSGLLVGLYTISDFGAVSLLRYDTFTRAIYTLYRGQIDRRPSATLSLILMAFGDRHPPDRAPISSQGRPSLPPSAQVPPFAPPYRLAPCRLDPGSRCLHPGRPRSPAGGDDNHGHQRARVRPDRGATGRGGISIPGCGARRRPGDRDTRLPGGDGHDSPAGPPVGLGGIDHVGRLLPPPHHRRGCGGRFRSHLGPSPLSDLDATW